MDQIENGAKRLETMDDVIRYAATLSDSELDSVRLLGKKGKVWIQQEIVRRGDVIAMTDSEYKDYKRQTEEDVRKFVTRYMPASSTKAQPRREEVIRLRESGMTYRAIGEQIGVKHPETVRQMYEVGLMYRRRIEHLAELREKSQS